MRARTVAAPAVADRQSSPSRPCRIRLWYRITPMAFARSRTTSVFDAVMLCDRSHDDIHVGGKTLRLKDGRLLGPNGWVPQIRVA